MAAVPSTTVAGDLYERHGQSVLRYCRSRLRARDEAEDAAQTTFMRAVQGLRAGVAPEHAEAWLLSIARNVCHARIETQRRRRRLEQTSDPATLNRAPAGDGRHEELLALEAALERLPERQRHAVVLRDWRGLTYHEIADALGVSHASVETLIFRGRAALAAELSDSAPATRRRLGSLADAGSLLAMFKQWTGGAALAGKAGAVAAVAAAGGTLAVSGALSDAFGRGGDARTPAPASPARVPSAVADAGTATLAPPLRRPAAAPAPAHNAATAAPARGPAAGGVGTEETEPKLGGSTPAAAPAEEPPPPAPATRALRASPAPDGVVAVEETVVAVEETVVAVEETVAAVEETVAALEGTVAALEETVAAVEGTVAAPHAEAGGAVESTVAGAAATEPPLRTQPLESTDAPSLPLP